MLAFLPLWFLPVLGSALLLGLYDLSTKHAVRENAVMPALFFATLSGSALYIGVSLISGTAEAAVCGWSAWGLIWLKSVLVSASWICVYYAMRELPISIAAPIRASSPLWTFLGGLWLFHEIPTLPQAAGMALMFAGYYVFSVLGKMEGISFLKAKGIHLILLGTLLGAASALYDKYLLNVRGIPVRTVLFWFSADLVLTLGTAYAVRTLCFGRGRRFQWRWSVPLTGIFLIGADFLYFYAVSLPDIQISMVSLVRRSSCIVSFAAGAWLFRDVNVKKKAAALTLLLLGIAVLALAK